MDERYLQYVMADKYFYDVPNGDNASNDTLGAYDVDSSCDWSTWDIHETASWKYFSLASRPLPDQGWKIHISASITSASVMLKRVSAYCHAHSLNFKYIPTENELLIRNSKYADRTGSGKFITIYPTTNTESVSVADALDLISVGVEGGSYILSDIRWNSGPVFLRYGAFESRFIRGSDGGQIPAIFNAEGELVPDIRDVGPHIPDWVTVPKEIQRQLDAVSNTEPPSDLKYSFDEALHFSNGGGVYKGRSLVTGETVIIKEGRPKAGLTADNRDAIERLEHERSVMCHLEDVAGIPKVIDTFGIEGHRFLVQEYIPGETFNSYLTHHTPFIRGGRPKRDEETRYIEDVTTLLTQIKRTLSDVHQKGVVFGDFHPNNVIITPDNTIAIIDFEMAHFSDRRRALAGAPGYVPNGGWSSKETDWYAFGCLMLNVFYPLSILFNLDQFKIEHICHYIKDKHPIVSDEYIEEAKKYIYNCMPRVQSSRNSIVTSIEHCISGSDFAKPDKYGHITEFMSRAPQKVMDASRIDRLFPADPEVFASNGTGYAYGASGILDMFQDSFSQEDTNLIIKWMSDRLMYTQNPTTLPDFGLVNGSLGTAITMFRYGAPEFAAQWLKELAQTDLRFISDVSLNTGLAGMCLGIRWLRKYHHGDDIDAMYGRVLERLIEASRHELLASTSGQKKSNEVGTGGLFKGLCGPSVALLAAYSDHESIDLARLARELIEAEVAKTVIVDDGSLQSLESNNRTLPYLYTGSGGIYIALMCLKNCCSEEEFQFDDEMTAIEIALSAPFCIQSGFFNGRSGISTILSCCDPSPDKEAILVNSTESLSLHALRFKDCIAFPGDQIMRLSMDFGTGGAGVMHALAATKEYVDGQYVHQDNNGIMGRVFPCIRPM